MKIALRLLEIITLIVWFGSIILAMNHKTKTAVALTAMTAGLWLIAIAIVGYLNHKNKDK